MKPTVTVEWLKAHLKDEQLIVLDASMAKVGGGVEESLNEAIPGARKMDLKQDFSDPNSDFPNTIPSEEQFEKAARQLGIRQDSVLVVYDNKGIYSSPRAWWLLVTMGHQEVYVLDGGLPAWKDKGYPTETLNESNYPEGNFKAALKKENVKYYDDILKNIQNPSFKVLDARSAGRFQGRDAEPRAWLQSGCIVNSSNVPYAEVLENGHFKSEDDLKEIFDEVQNEDLVFSCGSGLTACIIMMAHLLAGGNSQSIYDGSWTEWAELQGLKIDKE